MQTDKLVTDVYEFEEIIGEGGYSSVVLAHHVVTSRKYAIKIIDKSKLIGNDMLDARVRRECDINLRIAHQNIAKVYEIYESPDDICLVMELVVINRIPALRWLGPNLKFSELKGGELFDYIAKRGRLPEDEARPIMKSLLEAVAYLHGLGIAHRDLKPENILFTVEDKKLATVKLIDFGFAKIEQDESSILQTPIGTAAYVAPEVINSDQYRKSVDLWSLGCVLFFMLVGRPPFYSEDEEAITEMAAQGQYNYPSHVAISEQGKDLISRLLQNDPSKRLSALQALHHKWITGGLRTSAETDPNSLSSSEEQISQMRSAINRSIDVARAETEKKAETIDAEALAPVMLTSALDSPLWQRRHDKKRVNLNLVDDAGQALHPKESRV